MIRDLAARIRAAGSTIELECYEVGHLDEALALLAEGRIKVDQTFERMILHDPCYLGRHNGEYDAPRSVLAALTRDKPLEFELTREKAMCCGAGGGRMWLDEKIGRRINVTRVEQALPHSPAVIATACPYCSVMMGDGSRRRARPPRLTRDLAELVAEAMV
jgi:Fe-S oxidoreductase